MEARADVARQRDASRDDRLVAIVLAVLRELRPGSPLPDVRLDAHVERDLGLDSLSRVEVASRVEDAFGVSLPDDVATRAHTLRELADAIAAAPSRRRTSAAAVAVMPPPEPIEGAPERTTTLLEAFAWHVERHATREHVTLLDGDEIEASLTYGALWDRAAAIAQGLKERGIAHGDTVALMLPTSAGFFETFLGTLMACAVPVPLYPPLRWSEIEAHVRGRAAIIASSQARLLVTVPEAKLVGELIRSDLPGLRAVVNVEELRQPHASPQPPVASPHDLAMLQYTSGSTGDPKGVMLAHDNLLANIRAMGRAAAACSTDRFVSWLPLYHDMGLIGAWLTTMYHGIPLVIMSPVSFLARPSRWLRAVHRFRGTISGGPNFAYEIAASKIRDEEIEGVDLSSWRLAFNGAEPVRARTLERFAARFARHGFDRRALTPVYGLAEGVLGLTFPPLERGPRVISIDARALESEGVARAPAGQSTASDFVSCGAPLPGHEVRIVDDHGHELPARREGRVEFRGPSATRGYYRNAQATAKLLHADWLDTGDVGFVDGGELYVTSRVKDLIKRGGHNIHPYDLESAIGEITGIRKGCVAVFGVADPVSGSERVVVVAETNETEAASRTALRERIQALAVVHLDGPADEVILARARTVLKTSSGKIRRAACRELYERRMLGDNAPAVWLQLARLAIKAARSSVRRASLAAAGVAYGVYAWLVVLALGLLVGAMLLVVPGSGRRYRLAHRAAALLVRLLGIPLRVGDGGRIASPGAGILVANHASYADAILLLAALPSPVHFVAKREFATAPVFHYLFHRLGVYFVERTIAAQGVEDVNELTEAVRRGETILVFPEGTFTRAPGLRPFRLGAFVVAARTGIPVTPVLLRGTRSLLRDRTWLPVRYPVEVTFEVPAVPNGTEWHDAIALRDRVYRSMTERAGETFAAA